MSINNQSTAWWQDAVFYQIYPRSFSDTDGNGVGDLQGIINHLEYLDGLGIDALWLSPVYPSPMADHGYDVSDYCDIDPLFGTLAEFDALVQKSQALDIKIVMDLVANHTSDQHPWFKESRSSKNNPKRDWYVWRDPAPGGGPPNNWRSFFGGPAWTFDELSGQYYLHKFLPQQPDLNNWNPAVNQAILQSMEFWLERGVAGFRMDVVDRLLHDPNFADAPLNPTYDPAVNEPSDELDWVKVYYHADVHLIIAQIRILLDRYGAVGIGEVHAVDLKYITNFYANGAGLHLPFNFTLLHLPWDPRAIGKHIQSYESALTNDAWPNYVLGNHDNERLRDRVGVENLKLAAMLLLTLRGTLFLYYGDELGLSKPDLPKGKWQDPHHIRVKSEWTRDFARGPMQWSPEVNAGFTTGTPWLPTAPNYAQVNVANEEKDPGSLLNLYKLLLALHRGLRSLRQGTIKLLQMDKCLIYLRQHEEECIWVGLNFDASAQHVELPTPGVVLADTNGLFNHESLGGLITLEPYSGYILKLT